MERFNLKILVDRKHTTTNRFIILWRIETKEMPPR